MVTIKHGDFTAVVRKRGANCISLKNSAYNASILREPPLGGKLDNPYLYGMPILFPVNRISGAEFKFEERLYRFPLNEPETGCHLHGQLHNTPFEIQRLSENSVTLSRTEDATDGFMHKYRVTVTYRLCDRGLIHETEINNLSDKNMPCMLGFHTTFNVPFICDSNGASVKLLADVGELIERDQNFLPTGRILQTDNIDEKIKNGTFDPLSAPISRHYPAVGRGRIELFDSVAKLRIAYKNDNSFKYRLFYNGNADSYICLEPQNCMVNSPNSPFGRVAANFEFLPPHTSKIYKSEIHIEKVEGL